MFVSIKESRGGLGGQEEEEEAEEEEREAKLWGSQVRLCLRLSGDQGAVMMVTQWNVHAKPKL